MIEPEEFENKIKGFPSEVQQSYRKVKYEIREVILQECGLDEFYNRVVNIIQSAFDFYSVNLYIVESNKKWIALKAGTSEFSRTAIQRGHHLDAGSRTLIGSSVDTGRIRIALDDMQNPLTPYIDLPPIHTELCVPLISLARHTVIGALDIASTKYNAFQIEDCFAFEAIASDVSAFLENKILFD
jgi:putative methionine-R-sulfoxide reductase with GAF domain